MSAPSRNFLEISLSLLRKKILVLLALSAFFGAFVALLAMQQGPWYQSKAVVTLTDWQNERLARRNRADDVNPANVGGAAADELSRALVLLEQDSFWQEGSFSKANLQFEHKRRGNFVTLKLKSREQGEVEASLRALVTRWDLALKTQFINEREAWLLVAASPVLLAQAQSAAFPAAKNTPKEVNYAKELKEAHALVPFALLYLEPPSAEKVLSKAWGLWGLCAALMVFLLGFSALLLKRLSDAST